MKALHYLFLIVFHAACLSGFSQKDPLRFGHLETDAGLSNNRVKNIFKDKKGFIWFATQSGLNRYDGTDFKIFRSDEHDSTSPVDNSFKGIFELPEEKMGVLTSISGLNIYDPLTEKFDRKYQRYFRRWGLPEKAVSNIRKDVSGNYWFLFEAGDLYRYNPANRKTFQIPLNRAGTNDSSAPVVSAFSQDTKGNTWLIYRNGLIEKLDTKGHPVFHHSLSQHAKKNKTSAFTIYVDGQDDLWIGALNFGVFYYNPQTDSTLLFQDGATRFRLNTNNITIGLQGIVQDNDGKIWVATDQGGVNLIDKKDFSVQYLMHEQENSESISQNAVACLYKDNTGIIWAGTYKQGVNFYNKNLDKFPLLKHYISDANSLPYDDVNCFAEDAGGNLWIGTNGGGLIYYDRRLNKFSRFKHNPSDPKSLCGDIVVSLCIDHDQKLWIGTYLNGMDRYDGKKFTHYRHNPAVPESISENNVWEILEDSKQNLWIGTISSGLDRFDRAKNIFYHYRNGEPDLKASGFISLYVSTLAEDKAGNILIGTSGGLEILNVQTKRFSYYTLPGGAGNNYILFIKIDSRGLIWVSTNKGLNLFDPQKKVFKVFTKQDGLPDDMVFTILEDDMHNLWMSTPKGFCNLTIKQEGKDGGLSFHFKNYGKTDGLQGIEFNENAAFKTKKGELIFGGPFGVNIFNPGNVAVDKTPPGIILTDFQLFGKSIKAGETINDHVILSQGFPETKAITLHYDENFFSIQFADLDFSKAKKPSFEYMLENFNKNWVTLSSTQDKKVTYTNVDPGTYTFKIKAVSSDGIFSKTLALQITIVPPFWMTWWFKMGLILTLIGGATGFYLIRINTVKAQKRQLEQKVQEQTAQLLTSNQEERKARQEADEANRAKSVFLATMSHEIRTPMNGVIGMASLLMHSGLTSEQKSYAKIIATSGEGLLSVINGILDFSKIESGKMELENTLFDLQICVEEALDIFSPKAAEAGIKLAYHIDTNVPLQITGDSLRLRQILINLVGNAIKFTAKGEVFIGVHLQNTTADERRQISFNVRDTGIGIPADKIERLFKAFSQVDSSTTRKHGGTGLGLVICEKLVALMGGSIAVASEPGKGTTFTFSILASAAMPPVTIDTNGHQTVLRPNGFHQAAEQKLTTDFSKQHPLRILVAEDNPINALIINKILNKLGYTVVTAENGREVLSSLNRQNFDLIFMDVQMPEMDGLETTKSIRENFYTQPVIIAMTANAMQGDREECIEAGMDDYLSKPINLDGLVNMLKKWTVRTQVASN